MSCLSQAPPLGGLSPPHGAFQEHATHAREWSIALSSKGSLGTCIPKGVSTFFHTAFTAHSEGRADAGSRRLQPFVRPRPALARRAPCPRSYGETVPDTFYLLEPILCSPTQILSSDYRIALLCVL